MAVAVTCTGVVQDTNGYTLNFTDGNSLQFPNLAAMANAVFGSDADAVAAKKWLIGDWLRRNPAGDDPNLINGYTCYVNITAENKVQVVAGGS